MVTVNDAQYPYEKEEYVIGENMQQENVWRKLLLRI